MSDYIQTPQNESAPQKPKKKGSFLKVLAIVVLAIIVASGVTVLGYYTFLPAKYTLMIAEYSNVLKSFNTFDKNMTRFEERVIKPRYENTIQKETELGISVEDSLLEQLGVPTGTIDLIQSGLKTMKIKLGYALDAKSTKQTASLGLSPFVTLDLFIDGTNFGLGVPEFTNKTVIGQFQDLDKLSDVFPEMDPMLLEAYKEFDPWLSTRIYEEVKIDRAEIKKLMLDYSKALIGSIKSKDMSIKRGQKTEVLGQNLSCQEVTITLDRNAQLALITDILEKLEKDDLVYDLTAGNIIKLYQILNENGLFHQIFEGIDLRTSLSKSNFRTAIAQMKKDLDPNSFPEEVKVKIYINGLDVVKNVIAFSGSNADTAVVSVEQKIDGLSFERLLKAAGSGQDEDTEISLHVKKDYDASSDTTDLNLELNIDMKSSDGPGKLVLTLESLEEPEGNNEVAHSVNAALKLDLDSSITPAKGEFTHTMVGSKIRDSKGLTTSSEYKGNITVNMPDYLPQTVKLGFGSSTETAYGVNVNIPEPNEVLDISTATQEDYDDLMNDFYEKLGPLLLMLYGF